MTKDEGMKSIKIGAETLATVRKLVTALHKRGWKSIGANRDDRVGIATVVDEAVRRLSK